MIPIASTAALALAGSFLTETRLKATLTADGHSPKVNTRWNYVLKLTRDGKPVAAKVTARIIDPIGDVHTVHRANTTNEVTNWSFKGEFSDSIVWPPAWDGVPVKVRFTVHAGPVEKVISYAVTPHG